MGSRSRDCNEDIKTNNKAKTRLWQYSSSTLGSLDVVLNEAMRRVTGAMKTTAICNLHVLCNECSLGKRRKELLLQYFFKSKCHIRNPAYNCVVNTNLETLFLSRPCGTPIILRIKEALHAMGIPTQPVLPY